MNDRLSGLWDWWFWHRKLTGELLDVLRDEHLAFSPGETHPALAQLCAHMADTQTAYIDSLQTRSLDFDVPEPSAPAATVSDLQSQFNDLDSRLRRSLEAIPDEAVETLQISRGDEKIPILLLMSSLVESLLIFHGKISVYARLAGVELPPSWSRFI